MRLFRSLTFTLPALVLAVLVLAAGLGLTAALTIGRGHILTERIDASRDEAATYASAVGFYVMGARSAVEATASAPVVRRALSAPAADADAEVRAMLAGLVARSRTFDAVMLLGPDGRVRLLEPEHLERQQSRRDRAYAAWFQNVRRTGGSIISDLVLSPATQRPTVVAATAVRDAEGRVIGVLAGSLRLDELSRIGTDIGPPHGPSGLVTDRRGLVIAHQARPEYVLYQTDVRSVPAVREALEGRRGAGRFADPLERVDKVGAWLPLPETGWAVVHAEPARNAFAPFTQLAVGLAAATLAITAVLAAVSIHFARRLVRPLVRVTGAVERLGAGDSVERVLVDRPDEIGRLADAFNRMTAALAAQEAALRQRAAEVDRANRELRAAAHAKDQFLAMLGHELRNPLGAIAGAVGVLDVADRQRDVSERARAVIHRQVAHLSHLVDDLLDVSRVTTGKVVLDRQPLDLAALVAGSMSAWRSAGRFDRHEVGVEASAVWVQADETRMEQVLSNLVGNALKYTPAGGRVAVSLMPAGETAVLEVTDTGAGMPTGLIDQAFDLFMQGDRAIDRAQGGLGIGLTLVKALVEMHGGRVEAQSDGPGKGAKFTVCLPAIAARARTIDTGPSRRVDGPRRRILVIEDNADAREMLRVGLTLAGHEVHEAADGPAGVEAAARVKPDIALVDVGLPGLDGYEVARRIRATPEGRAMLLIAITGYGQAEDRRRALDAGFDAHLTKPVLPERLAELIAAMPGTGAEARAVAEGPVGG